MPFSIWLIFLKILNVHYWPLVHGKEDDPLVLGSSPTGPTMIFFIFEIYRNETYQMKDDLLSLQCY